MEEVAHDAAEENGEQLYELEPEREPEPEPEPQTQEEELYQNPEETTAAAGGDVVSALL